MRRSTSATSDLSSSLLISIVTIQGKVHYLGPHGSADSKREYGRRFAGYLPNQSSSASLIG
jgi:hypothetical protein